MAEDDRVSGMVAAKLLVIAGAVPTVVEDGRQALEALARERFDLALMDVQMPIMDGVEATRAIRRGEAGQDMRNLPVIAMTAYAMAGDRETFLEAGMDGYLAKPATTETLVRSIRDVLAARTPAP
ncbi:MAG: response regulator [Desulfovibrio sp.]|nr:response regulator [Desulfovibrio sp.]